ncbi:glycosyl hydrolase 53 family protein [Pseudaeromonas sp. ZJS20]|uniref:glycoside hydrolase family 53 protein n=1 Tax=Pseudaeromonas aegiceratis TaxID=3153928 RepID=UPI00390CCDDB
MTEFANGADISSLPEWEQAGMRYCEGGEPRDLLAILRQQGVNALRIKVWNEPGVADVFPANQGHPLGFNNPDQVLALARRAHALGFRLMLDFHYSDWWADPAKQFMPRAWLGLPLAVVCQRLYDFTHALLARLAAEGIQAEWVQVGNEITHGLLWPLGMLPGHWPALAQLLRAGCAAVKAAQPQARTVLHLDAGGDGDLYGRWFAQAQALGVDWDAIGLSFYPCWHGPQAALADNLARLAARYAKPLLVVETAYPWRLDAARNQHWLMQHTGAETYPASPAGQAAFLRDLRRLVQAVPNGLGQGLFYWEPAMGAKPGERFGVWQNVTLFDEGGEPLPGLAALGGG